MNNEFNCKSKQIADYLVKNGSKLLRIDKVEGLNVYVFEHDETIGKNIDRFKALRQKCIF